ncbi:hypothetical protein ACDX66_01005 [Peribacillus frigoritolerans]
MGEKKNGGSWLEGFLGLVLVVWVIGAIGYFIISAVFEIFLK